MECKGAVFDLDGVLAATDELHFNAWRQTFEEVLYSHSRQSKVREFTYDGDYKPLVDDRPRYQGVKAFLESRDMSLPFGTPSDPPEHSTICGIGNRKNITFRKLVRDEGVKLYDSTLAFIHLLHERGVKVGVASFSKNSRYILQETGLSHLFEAVVEGVASSEMGLGAKPDPDIYLLAAERLGLNPYDCIMVEDSDSGVEAGRNGNFGLVLGLAHTASAQSLYSRGADIVVADMSELSLDNLDIWFADTRHKEAWSLRYYGFNPSEERLREALTTVGNGYFGTRGAYEGEGIRGNTHYPGTYIAGMFNRVGSEVHGKTIYNNDFVNCPNWLGIELRVENGTPLRPLDCEILDYAQQLDIRNAVLLRELTLRDRTGHVTTIRSRRIASMDQAHIGAIEYTITPQNYSGTVSLGSSLDGSVFNYGVQRYRELNSKHLEPIESGEVVANEVPGDGTRPASENQVYLHVRTNQSHVKICMNAISRFTHENEQFFPDRQVTTKPGIVTELFTLELEQGQSYTYEKTMGLFTSAAWDSDAPEQAAREVLDGAPRFERLLERHRAVWTEYWTHADFVIEGDRFAQKAIRLHAYHLLTTANPKSTFVDWGLPARGLHGEAYRGHIFWDELFISPFYNLHFPVVTRNHLMYRYRRLEAARAIAREEGFSGALYPWQSADDGSRDSQTLHYNPNSGEWDRDLTYLQRHINIAVAYNIWEYFYTTADEEFMDNYGIEMLLEIARFWADIAEFEEQDGRYHIRKVVGPDEFHTRYPESEDGGLNDNAYTNIMTAWLLHKTVATYKHRPEVVQHDMRERLSFEERELELWDNIVHKMYVPIREDGLLEQFTGWMELDELNWNEYRKKYGNIRRLDRILKAEGVSPNRYKAIKQADVLQCFYMLSPGQVSNILGLMGYEAAEPRQLLETNYDYYTARTSHGSTLSYVVHSSISNYLATHRQDKWNWFLEALRSDLYDTQGGTTMEGIHCGVMAGTIEILFKGFAGVNLYKDKIELNPHLPGSWRKLSFKITHRGTTLVLDILPDKIYATRLIDGREEPMGCTEDGSCYTISLR